MIRYATAQDKPRIRCLWEQGFGNDEPYTGWYFSRVYRSERTLLYEEAGTILSSLQLAPYVLCVGGRELPAAYIVGVVTDEGHRGRGYASELLRRALNDLDHDGYRLALLYTDIPGFYEPLGFTCCYGLRRLRFAAAAGSDAFARREPDAETIAHCDKVYRSMCRSFDGYVLRSHDNWLTYSGDWLTDKRNGLYVGDNAYILTDVSEETFAVKEIGFADGEALTQALACCAHLAAAQGYPDFIWDAPESAPLPRQEEETRRPWVMARVTGQGELTAPDAAAATRKLLGAPDPRLWVGEIT